MPDTGAETPPGRQSRYRLGSESELSALGIGTYWFAVAFLRGCVRRPRPASPTTTTEVETDHPLCSCQRARGPAHGTSVLFPATSQVTGSTQREPTCFPASGPPRTRRNPRGRGREPSTLPARAAGRVGPASNDRASPETRSCPGLQSATPHHGPVTYEDASRWAGGCFLPEKSGRAQASPSSASASAETQPSGR